MVLIHGGTEGKIIGQLARRDTGIRKAARVLRAFAGASLGDA